MRSTASRTLATIVAWTGSCLLVLAAHGKDGEVVINEISYNPPGDGDNLQFVELYNSSDSEVDLSGWAFTAGIRFAFPDGTRMTPGSYLAICRSRTAFAKHYGEELPAIGDFGGRLSHGGERLELADARKTVIDVLRYSDRPPWPVGADGYSPSLERICPRETASVPENWAASSWRPDGRAAGSPGRKNESHSANLPPVVSEVQATTAPATMIARVSAVARDPDGVARVDLSYRVVIAGRESEETSVPMARIAGSDKRGAYGAEVAAQPEGTLLRFRIHTVDGAGMERFHPSEKEPRPTHSMYLSSAAGAARIALGILVQSDPAPVKPRKAAAGDGPGGERVAASGKGAFVYIPAQGVEPQVFDHVRIGTRKGGLKIRFHRDHTFKGMTVANLISEGNPRWLLTEPLSYELYRMVGVPAPLTEHIRLSKDGRPAGPHLLVEQPNRSFLARNGRDLSGNLYKVVWYGRDLIRQHQKKTKSKGGHEDLVELVRKLESSPGADPWQTIESSFDVGEVSSYYAVSMCTSDWDGFHNNYITYHDTAGSGKWEIYPWDKDKTWGDYDHASREYDWYEMPLTMGMEDDRPPPIDLQSKANNRAGFLGNVSWWRQGGCFSRPLLANSRFRELFLARLEEVCALHFTEESLLPKLDAMERDLGPEIHAWGEASGKDPRVPVAVFKKHMDSIRKQVKHRREFILSELKKPQ